MLVAVVTLSSLIMIALLVVVEAQLTASGTHFCEVPFLYLFSTLGIFCGA